MSYILKLIFSALLALLLGGQGSHAAEFEVLDRFSVDGYAVLKGSADIPGGSFSVGGSTLVVKNGNIGIGTTGPGARLHVTGTESRFGGVASGYISVYNANGRSGYLQANQSTDFRLGADSDPFTIYTNGSERVRVDNTGNVGIGTSNPAASLNVVSTNTVSTAFKVQTGSISGTEVVISTSGNLDVAGGIKVGVYAADCTTAIAGTLRWYGGHISVCNGSDWRQLDNQPPPAVSAITPASGLVSGGTIITISGGGFNLGLEVLIGGTAATVGGITGSQITATTPAGSSGSKEVKITNTDGQYCISAFTYNSLPTIATVSPSSGQTSKTTNITIAGTGFQTGAGVTIGGVTATVNTVSATEITAIAPAIASNGAKNVIVTNSDTGSVTLTGGFTYLPFATGGAAEHDFGAYHVHVFSNSGTFAANFAGNIDILVVAGGGSGGGNNAGGGGAGGLIYNSAVAVTAQSYSVTVGNGGAAVSNAAAGNTGQNSVFGALITAHGGGGGGAYSGNHATSGGSGGGGGTSANGAAGIPGEGKDGSPSQANSPPYAGGGGGGAGAVGQNANPGQGGAGLNYSAYFGTTVGVSGWFAGGGGGGGNSSYAAGGQGGGGAGATSIASPGISNTGGGGGGGGGTGSGTSGAGGSGIVIVRYLR